MNNTVNYHRFKHFTFSQSLHVCPTKPTAAPHIFFPVLLRNNWYTNCTRFRHVQHDGLIYRYCEMMTTGVQLTAIFSYRYNKKKKKEKRRRKRGKNVPCDENSQILLSYLSYGSYISSSSSHLVVHYISSTYLSYNWKSVLFNAHIF